MGEFKREERYIVIKRKQLTEMQEQALRAHIDLRKVPTVECVVVESDWPEYETVWGMIEARVTGFPTPTAEKADVVEAVAFLRDLADRLCKVPCVHHDGYDIDRLRELAVAMQARHLGKEQS